MNNTGIYKISGLCNKIYIGSSMYLRTRKNQHLADLRGNRHMNPKLQNYYNKHGENSLSFEVIEYCEKSKLLEREQFFIDTLKPAFNICGIAGRKTGVPSQLKGRKLTKAHIDLLVLSHKGIYPNEETKKLMKEKRGNSPRSVRRIINQKTGIIYSSIKNASQQASIDYNYLRHMLSGGCKNKTDLKYV